MSSSQPPLPFFSNSNETGWADLAQCLGAVLVLSSYIPRALDSHPGFSVGWPARTDYLNDPMGVSSGGKRIDQYPQLVTLRQVDDIQPPFKDLLPITGSHTEQHATIASIPGMRFSSTLNCSRA